MAIFLSLTPNNFRLAGSREIILEKASRNRTQDLHTLRKYSLNLQKNLIKWGLVFMKVDASKNFYDLHQFSSMFSLIFLSLCKAKMAT